MNVPLATRFLGSKHHCTSAVGEVSLVGRETQHWGGVMLSVKGFRAGSPDPVPVS